VILGWAVARQQNPAGGGVVLLPEIFNLGKAFRQYFEVVPALSDALKDEVYRIRHQVYCEELAYEPPRPDRRESDEYDAHSLHVLIRSVHLGEFIGCTRVVRARPQDPYYPLPFEKSCAATLDRSIVDSAKLARDTIGEISRLAVIARFRKRKGEEKYAVGLVENYGTLTQPRFPYIPAGLYIGTIELARLNGIDTLFCLTEERLANHLRKLGVKLHSIGGPVELHGLRGPSMMSASAIIKDFNFIVRPLYRTIAEEVARGR
jgi:N-acyl amino acid synthase of PEP-CTERM/exosortase system